MSYEDIVDDLADRVEGLDPQRRAAMFWLVGSGLRSGLEPSESAGWDDWFDNASRVSLEFILRGYVDADAERVWALATRPADDDATQLLNSVVICLSSPIAIALDPSTSVSSWIEHALFPVIQRTSLHLFDDVAFPDDDDLEDVVADGRVQAAVSYCVSVSESLASQANLGRHVLEQLLDGARVLNE